MSAETRNVLLYGQLQSGLTLELSKAPAVSGARNYDELCIAAKNEEKRLAELEKRQQYGRSQSRYFTKDKSPGQGFGRNINRDNQFYKQQPRCYVCNSPNHLARQKSESEGKTSLPKKTKVVRGGRLSRGSSPEIDSFQGNSQQPCQQQPHTTHDSDISDDPSSVSTCKHPQGPRMTSQRTKKWKRKDIQPVHHRYNLRSRKKTKA